MLSTLDTPIPESDWALRRCRATERAKPRDYSVCVLELDTSHTQDERRVARCMLRRVIELEDTTTVSPRTAESLAMKQMVELERAGESWSVIAHASDLLHAADIIGEALAEDENVAGMPPIEAVQGFVLAMAYKE